MVGHNEHNLLGYSIVSYGKTLNMNVFMDGLQVKCCTVYHIVTRVLTK